MIHVPYKGTGPALTDTMAGQVQILFGSVAATLPQMSTGRLRPSRLRHPKIAAAPNILTVAESGLKTMKHLARSDRAERTSQTHPRPRQW